MVSAAGHSVLLNHIKMIRRNLGLVAGEVTKKAKE